MTERTGVMTVHFDQPEWILAVAAMTGTADLGQRPSDVRTKLT